MITYWMTRWRRHSHEGKSRGQETDQQLPGRVGGRDRIERGNGTWVNFWRILEKYLDSGGGSTTGYVSQNLQNCTLKRVNNTICRLNLLFFFFNGVRNQSSRSGNLPKGNQLGSGRLEI